MSDKAQQLLGMRPDFNRRLSDRGSKFVKIFRKLLETMGYTVIHETMLEQWRMEQFRKHFLPSVRELSLEYQRADILGDEEFMHLYAKCKSFSMTTIERLYALHKATKYIVDAGIEGSFVECGVWRGGSSMMMVMTLRSLGVSDRDIYLYDTYSGMPAPRDIDIDYSGVSASEHWKQSERETHNEWCYAPLEEVQENLNSTGYPSNKIHFIKGRVEETLVDNAPREIAVLRLDTDWFESTQAELKNLFPQLRDRGVLIVDDYGYWKGQKLAVDQYLKEIEGNLLLSRIDHAARLILKV